MIKNLTGKININKESEIVVIGAGTVGLLISSILSKKGYNVITLESGKFHQESETHPLNKVLFEKSVYNSSNTGRFRCMGGTSTRWGAALLPLLHSDIVNAKWPIFPDDILKYQKDVENIFNLPNDEYLHQEDLLSNNSDFILRYAKMPSFKKRNIYNVFKEIIDSEKGPEIFLNSTVTNFKVNNNCLEEIDAISDDGSKINLKGKQFIFAAGAIESTRLLLLLDKQNNNCIKNESPNLGKFFCDHISIPVSEIKVKDQKKMNKIFGYHFDKKKSMKNIRFEMSEESAIRNSLPPFFARVIFDDMSGGYESLRNFFRIIKKKKIPPFKYFLDLLKTSPWIFKAIWWRFVNRRLVFPKNSTLETHIIMEQISSIENKISLSETEKDMFDQPLASISWSIGERDSNNIFKAANFIKNFWNSGSLKQIGDFNLYDVEKIKEKIREGDGIHHPTGSTRMSLNPKEGVVDSDLKVFSLSNTSVLSTSVLPTGTGANPTMTLFMLALRLVDHISKDKR